MTNWKDKAKPATIAFFEEIRGQMDDATGALFELALNELAKPKPNKLTLKRLDKLDALEAAGVDNWEGYEEAMEDLDDDEDEEYN